MNKVLHPIGHKSLVLADIDPTRSPAYSPNLHKYMKAHGNFYPGGGLAQSVFSVREGSVAAASYGAGTLMIGFLSDGPYFHGGRMIGALCRGEKEPTMAYPIARSLQEIEGFWDKYLALGRCAIDPEHREYFLADRFALHDGGRSCVWCGFRQRKVVTPRIVEDVTWVTEAAENE